MSGPVRVWMRSEEHTSELQSSCNLVCRLLLEKKNPLAGGQLISARDLLAHPYGVGCPDGLPGAVVEDQVAVVLHDGGELALGPVRAGGPVGRPLAARARAVVEDEVPVRLHGGEVMRSGVRAAHPRGGVGEDRPVRLAQVSGPVLRIAQPEVGVVLQVRRVQAVRRNQRRVGGHPLAGGQAVTQCLLLPFTAPTSVHTRRQFSRYPWLYNPKPQKSTHTITSFSAKGS